MSKYLLPPSPAARLAAAALFPGLLLLAVLTTWTLIQRGMVPGAAASIPLVAVTLAVLAAERLFPYDPAWNRSRGDLGTDLVSTATLWLPEALAARLGHVAASFLSVSAVAAIGPSLWPSRWPLTAQVIAIALVADLGKYTLHRLSHERPWLWKFHAVHHEPERIYVLNGLRIHPVNLLWNFAFDVSLPLALGLDPRAMAVYAAIRGVVSIFQHANLPLRLGPLNWIFSTNELHRWHHSTNLTEGNTNYGSMLILWDTLFGTRHLPRDRARPEAVGLAPPTRLPRSWLGQTLWPLCGEKTSVSCGPARLRWLLK